VKRVLIAAGVLALALPAAAGAKIVPQRSIAGVSLGMGQRQVLALLGQPQRKKDGKNEFGPYRIMYFARVTVWFQGLTSVTQVATTSPLERTAAGVGVGSTESDVKAKVPGVACQTGHCSIGKFNAGARVTDFFLSAAGRVTRVVVGFVID
jgi:hypothetical protein